MIPSDSKVMLLIGVALMLLVGQISSTSLDQAITKEQEEMLAMGPRTKLVSLPNSLIRLLFYNTLPVDRQTGNVIGYKRSSSALDALTGVTLGKRAAPMELLNLEPFYGRHYAMRSMPRMYDMRWAPLDSYDSQFAPETN